MSKSAIIIGLIMFGLGVIAIFSFYNGFYNGSYNSNNIETSLFISYVGYFLAGIGAIIIGAHFKGWLERATGTRF